MCSFGCPPNFETVEEEKRQQEEADKPDDKEVTKKARKKLKLDARLLHGNTTHPVGLQEGIMVA